MEYTVYCQGKESGSVRLEPAGLYLRLSARCGEPAHGVWRLWACVGTKSRLVGVLFPETGGLRLEKRISRHSWPILPDCFVLGRETEGFRPWRGILEGREIPDALLRENGDGSRTLALFPPPEGPLPLAEYVGLMREGALDGRPCLLLELPDGLPELTEPEACAQEPPAAEPTQTAQAPAPRADAGA